MKANILIWLFSIANIYAMAQFPPPAGVEGTTAIHMDSSAFINWAKSCTIERGYLDISHPEIGFVDYGSEDDGILKADLSVVSLGDGGTAVLTFDPPIINGDGFDFAVFENSFSDDFLELALVYISSDGIDYDLFPAFSYSPTETQIAPFGTIDATKIHNLAGKYRMAYGTPFDISDIEDALGKVIPQISHIKLVDVIGSIDEQYATYDSEGNIINDPWPTAFPSGGFDLDAIGVIHQLTDIDKIPYLQKQITVYPNPNSGHFYIKNKSAITSLAYEIRNIQGQIVKKGMSCQQIETISLELKQGVYSITFIAEGFSINKRFIVCY